MEKYMNDGIIILLVFVSIIGGLILGVDYLSFVTCEKQWANSGFNSKYTIMTGCMIEVQKDKWIPDTSYREIDS